MVPGHLNDIGQEFTGNDFRVIETQRFSKSASWLLQRDPAEVGKHRPTIAQTTRTLIFSKCSRMCDVDIPCRGRAAFAVYVKCSGHTPRTLPTALFQPRATALLVSTTGATRPDVIGSPLNYDEIPHSTIPSSGLHSGSRRAAGLGTPPRCA